MKVCNSNEVVAAPIAIALCRKCGDHLRGHEDESSDLCRWCATGWVPSKPEDEVAATSA